MKGTTLTELLDAETNNYASAFVVTQQNQIRSAFFRSWLAK